MTDVASHDEAPATPETCRTQAENTVRGRFARQTTKLTADFRGLGDIARDAVHEKLGGLQSILIAAGIGLLIGRFWRRR